jgi:hypothetical protein
MEGGLTFRIFLENCLFLYVTLSTISDLRVTNALLYHLSHGSIMPFKRHLMILPLLQAVVNGMPVEIADKSNKEADVSLPLICLFIRSI